MTDVIIIVVIRDVTLTVRIRGDVRSWSEYRDLNRSKRIDDMNE